MEIKNITTKEEYEEQLANFQALMDKGDGLTDDEFDFLNIIAALLEKYEQETLIVEDLDPIEAINIRMEELGLKPEDLIPFIGSRSKVSEVMAGKVPLSLAMMKNLKDGLNIPANILLNQQKHKLGNKIQYYLFPIKEMVKRGYINCNLNDSPSTITEEIKKLIGSLSIYGNAQTLFRRTMHIRSKAVIGEYALFAWLSKIASEANKINAPAYDPKKLTKDFIKNLLKLGKNVESIACISEELRKIGIIVVIEKYLPQTYIDGACLLKNGKNPIIGLSLYHDRLDNFWFTLLHELGHIKLHYNEKEIVYVDNVQDKDSGTIEREADSFASNLLVPEEEWNKSLAKIFPSQKTIEILSDQLEVHPSIVAGKIRFKTKDYSAFADLVGEGIPSYYLLPQK